METKELDRKSNPVRRWRLARGFGQHELSVLLDCDRAFVSAIENGYPARLSFRIVEGLARLGANGPEIARQYVRWRARARKRMLVSGKESAEETEKLEVDNREHRDG